MKQTITLLLILSLSIVASSQRRYKINEETGVAIGLSGGVTNKHSLTGNFSIGGMFKNLNHASINLQVFSNARTVGVPVIGETRLGHVFGTVELYGGVGYHYAGNRFNKGVDDAHYPIGQSFSGYKNGFKPAYGILKHFHQSLWAVGAGMSGNIFSLAVWHVCSQINRSIHYPAHPSRSRLLYCIASARCSTLMSVLAARSAMVLETFKILS